MLLIIQIIRAQDCTSARMLGLYLAVSAIGSAGVLQQTVCPLCQGVCQMGKCICKAGLQGSLCQYTGTPLACVNQIQIKTTLDPIEYSRRLQIFGTFTALTVPLINAVDPLFLTKPTSSLVKLIALMPYNQLQYAQVITNLVVNQNLANKQWVYANSRLTCLADYCELILQKANFVFPINKNVLSRAVTVRLKVQTDRLNPVKNTSFSCVDNLSTTLSVFSKGVLSCTFLFDAKTTVPAGSYHLFSAKQIVQDWYQQKGLQAQRLDAIVSSFAMIFSIVLVALTFLSALLAVIFKKQKPQDQQHNQVLIKSIFPMYSIYESHVDQALEKTVLFACQIALLAFVQVVMLVPLSTKDQSLGLKTFLLSLPVLIIHSFLLYIFGLLRFKLKTWLWRTLILMTQFVISMLAIWLLLDKAFSVYAGVAFLINLLITYLLDVLLIGVCYELKERESMSLVKLLQLLRLRGFLQGMESIQDGLLAESESEEETQ